MIFKTNLVNSFINPSGYNVSGCKRIFLTEASEVGLYTVTNRQITEMSTNEPFAILEDLDGLIFSLKTDETKSGPLYVVDVAFTVSVLRADANYMLESLRNSEYTAIVEDLNGRFWLLGYREGLRTSYEMLSDDGGYAVKMHTKQRTAVQEVSEQVMREIELFDYYNSTTPNPIFSPQNPPVTGDGGNGGNTPSPGKIVNVTTMPYQVIDNDLFLRVMTSGTIMLPSSPSPGQQHIIKAYYDAEVQNVVIVPAAGHKIDNQSSILISTEMGSITLIFQGGHWSTVAFAI